MTDKLENRSSSTILNRIIFVLSIVGIATAIYVLQSFLRKSSIICLTGSGCEAVRKNPASYIAGIPVPAVGLVGYSFLLVLSFLRTMSQDKRLLHAMFGMGLFGVIFVSWFTYTEIYVIKGICSWCVLSAVNMFIIFFLVILSYRQLKEAQNHEAH